MYSSSVTNRVWCRRPDAISINFAHAFIVVKARVRSRARISRSGFNWVQCFSLFWGLIVPVCAPSWNAAMVWSFSTSRCYMIRSEKIDVDSKGPTFSWSALSVTSRRSQYEPTYVLDWTADSRNITYRRGGNQTRLHMRWFWAFQEDTLEP